MLTPLKTFCENMLTHVHKAIHIVFSTWEQGFKTSPTDNSTVPPALCTEKTGFHRVDRTLASTRPACPVSGSSEVAGVGLRPDASLRGTGVSGQAW